MPAESIADAYARAVRFHRGGRLAEAHALYRQIVAQEPGHADALHLLGVIELQSGRPHDAAALIQRAIAIAGDRAEFHNNLGEVWRNIGRPADATAAYARAVELQPDYAAAHNNLGLMRQRAGELDAADTEFATAIRLKPDYAAAHFNLGALREAQGRPGDAELAYHEALRHQPTLTAAHVRLGKLYCAANHPDAARAVLEGALRLAPNDSDAHMLLGTVAKDEGRLDDAIASYRRALACDPANHVAHSNLLYAMLYHPGYDAAQILQAHREWHDRHAAPLEPRAVHYANSREPTRKLRLGYVSANLRHHVVGFNLLPLFRHHDRAQFEIIVYSNGEKTDDLTDTFRRLSDNWRHCVGWTDARLAEQIVADGIDVLVDLTLHMAENRLLAFARRPAPVQATFAGYPGTTGVSAIQYRLTDGFLDPVGGPEPYVEQSARIPSFWCYQPQPDDPAPARLAAAEGEIVFGCLNNFCKVTPQFLLVWARVLRAVPDARLLLQAAAGPHRTRTLELLAQAGVDSARIEFVGRQRHCDYLRTYHRIDIVLDTFPYNGHTTSCDALWMGVPVVTLVGPTIAGRAGLSQLSNIGLTELIARSEDEFVAAAVALASDPTRLAGLRATLRGRMQASPLMDAVGFTRAIESTYREMWHRWCETPAAGP